MLKGEPRLLSTPSTARTPIDERQYRWVYTTPAMAAAITDHQWSVHELLAFRIPPPKWMPPKSSGRPSKQTLEIIQQWAS